MSIIKVDIELVNPIDLVLADEGKLEIEMFAG